ncbi:TetR/AcrR family transcriptional regulator [Saccharomonospora sp. NPDC046836]|uniref:TetR/AcrR family transcriptional regulator n=1 Tax=Saccharomonospora sp. NPDC046836 TaxID=3156921 RepID=UPI0033D0939E
MSDQRPYATLLAKGEDRRQRILAVAQRLLTSNGWRNTTLGQIAGEAGVSPAGLLHHFESKEQLLHAVLEARDAYDNAHRDTSGDLVEQIRHAAERFEQVPQLVGMFIVLLVENLDPAAPLRDRLLHRYQSATEIIADGIRRGQREGRYRDDVDPVIKARGIVAFLYGMETTWLLDPSVPVTEVFTDYTQSLALQLAVPETVR